MRKATQRLRKSAAVANDGDNCIDHGLEGLVGALLLNGGQRPQNGNPRPQKAGELAGEYGDVTGGNPAAVNPAQMIHGAVHLQRNRTQSQGVETGKGDNPAVGLDPPVDGLAGSLLGFVNENGHSSAARAVGAPHPTSGWVSNVTLRTSSAVVMPRATLSHPSAARVTMPSLTARSRISRAEVRLRIRS